MAVEIRLRDSGLLCQQSGGEATCTFLAYDPERSIRDLIAPDVGTDLACILYHVPSLKVSIHLHYKLHGFACQGLKRQKRVKRGRFSAEALGAGLLTKGADRIPADLAVHAEAAMAELCELFSAYLFSCKDAGQNKVEYSCLMIHAAGRNAQDSNL